MMEKNKVKELVQRFSKRFYKKKDHYWMDYGTRFNPTRDPKTNKIKYSASPGDKYKPWRDHHLTDGPKEGVWKTCKIGICETVEEYEKEYGD